MSSRRLVPAAVMLGVMLLQAAWVLAVPPFRGYDELDQAYRAAAVAHGEWIARGTAGSGRGGLVTVPADLVAAGHRQCESLPNMGHDNCNPAGTGDQPGMVRVASAASRYNPIFYWVVGSAGLPFHGVGSLYAMRVAASLICALGLAAAAWCLGRRRRGRWPAAGLVLAVSPVLAYSTTMPAPNGLEMVAGLVLWSSLLSLEATPAPGDRLTLGLAAAAAMLLVTLRSLGPLFAVSILLCVVLFRRGELRALVRSHRRGLAVAGLGSVLCGLASVWWILAQAPLGTVDGDPSRLSYWWLADVVPMGILQSVAAAPLVATTPPPIVYAVYLTLLSAAVVLAARHSRGPRRQGLLLALTLTQLIPLAVSAVGLHEVGLVWQGRYGLPFTAGVAVLAAVQMDRAQPASAPRFLMGAAGLGWALCQVLTCLAELGIELANSVSNGDPGWRHGSTGLVLLLAVGGALALGILPLTIRERVPMPAGGLAHQVLGVRPRESLVG